MKKQIEDKLNEIKQGPERTHVEVLIKGAMIACLESLLVPTKKKKTLDNIEDVEDMTA